MRSKIVILVYGILFTLLVSDSAICFDYSELYSELDITWDITPNEIIKNQKTARNILWFGKIKESSITPVPSGKVEILWLFSHHAFINPGPEALREPFHVVKKNSGYFLFTIILPNTTVKEAEKDWTKKLKEPYNVLVSGNPEAIGEYKGIQAVVIYASNFYFSNQFKIKFIEKE